MSYDPKAIKNVKHFRNGIALLCHKIRTFVKDIILHYKEKKNCKRLLDVKGSLMKMHSY